MNSTAMKKCKLVQLRVKDRFEFIPYSFTLYPTDKSEAYERLAKWAERVVPTRGPDDLDFQYLLKGKQNT